jgi:hypothetical protein
LPLPVLVAIVGVGIALVVLVVHLTGGSRIAEIAGKGAAVERFRIDFPDVEVIRCIISSDRRDAVLELSDGHVGLVHAIGSNYLTRFVNRGEMAAMPAPSRRRAWSTSIRATSHGRARICISPTTKRPDGRRHVRLPGRNRQQASSVMDLSQVIPNFPDVTQFAIPFFISRCWRTGLAEAHTPRTRPVSRPATR